MSLPLSKEDDIATILLSKDATFILPVDKTLWVSKQSILIGLTTRATALFFLHQFRLTE